MKFIKTNLRDAYIIEPEKREDERGFFTRAFCADEYILHGLNPTVAQCNLSRSEKKYTLRGFHYQEAGAEEAKSVRCTKGRILDVIIDLRKNSPTFLQHAAIELSADNYRMLYVPEFFAHAFITLEDYSEVFYLVSEFYTPGKERGIRWNDPLFHIDWPTDTPILSEKDRDHENFVI